jgi:hypothetical protein
MPRRLTTNLNRWGEPAMNVRHLLSITACVICAAIAGRVDASEVLYDGTGFLTGQQSFVQSFNITGPGTLTVSLSNVAWPEQLSDLNMVLSSTGGSLLGPEMGAGTDSFHVDSGTIYAQWFGTAQGPLDIGVYSLKVQFQPGTTAVPLPASIAVLLSGLGLLAWQRRGRRMGRTESA